MSRKGKEETEVPPDSNEADGVIRSDWDRDVGLLLDKSPPGVHQSVPRPLSGPVAAPTPGDVLCIVHPDFSSEDDDGGVVESFLEALRRKQFIPVGEVQTLVMDRIILERVSSHVEGKTGYLYVVYFGHGSLGESNPTGISTSLRFGRGSLVFSDRELINVLRSGNLSKVELFLGMCYNVQGDFQFGDYNAWVKWPRHRGPKTLDWLHDQEKGPLISVRRFGQELDEKAVEGGVVKKIIKVTPDFLIQTVLRTNIKLSELNENLFEGVPSKDWDELRRTKNDAAFFHSPTTHAGSDEDSAAPVAARSERKRKRRRKKGTCRLPEVED